MGVDSNGQFSDLGFGTSTQVFTSNGPGVSPTWQAAGGGASGVVVSANLASTISSATGDNVPFNPIFDTAPVNTGTSYDTTTGVFTAPSTGNYLYSIQLSFTGITALNVGSYIRAKKNGSFIQNNAINISNLADAIQTIATITMTGIAALTATDTLDFECAIGGDPTKNANLFGDSVSSTLLITKLL